ncbi:hypothetical protein [Arthrobacter sp. UYCu712]|uniref:hypothetical protein n=1 Tax=Arthrobacter sp. UYCu712 TaxID=3156340 RepID=UPI0033983EFE
MPGKGSVYGRSISACQLYCQLLRPRAHRKLRQSWWILWFLPLFAVIGIPDGWQSKTVCSLTIFFMIYAISDQIEVFPFLHPEDLTWPLAFARSLAAKLSVAAGMYMIYLDPKTKAMFKTAWANS